MSSEIYNTLIQDEKESHIPGYASFKIALSDEDMATVINALENGKDMLRNNFIFPFNIDIATDCADVITRKDVEEHIKEKCKIPEKDIINDSNKVRMSHIAP